jgi:hypothetical protein
MTKDEMQEFAVNVAELVQQKIAELKNDLMTETKGARLAAERAADIGHEVITRIDRLETVQTRHGHRLDEHDKELAIIGERLARLEGAAE